MKRSFLLVLTLLLVAVLSVGVLAQTKITVGAFPDADRALQLLLPAFHELYPDILVEIQSLGFDDHHTAMINSMAAGADLPDVVMVEIDYIARFTTMGAFVNLLEQPYNAGRYAEDFIPYKWAQGHTTDGRLMAMPKDIAPASVFYRRDIFEAAGLPSTPEEVQKLLSTWEGFIETGKILTRDASGDGRIDHWMLADAGELAHVIRRADHLGFFDEQGQPIVNRESLVYGVTIAQQARQAGLDARIGSWTTEWYEAIRRGTTATVVSGAWMGGHIRGWIAPETEGLWGVVSLPDSMYANYGGSFLAIPESSKNKDAAWKFIEFVTTKTESQVHMFNSSNIFPALIEAASDEVMDYEDPFFAGQKVRLLWVDVANKIPSVRVNRFDTVANELFGQALTAVLQEGADPRGALEDANAQIRRRAR